VETSISVARAPSVSTLKPEAPGRFHQLDGLRALACTLVVLHHLVGGALLNSMSSSDLLSVMARLFGGLTSSGVELFFVLSAVVLARPYIKDPSRFSIRPYIRRRVERLWPPFAAAWLLAGGVIALTSFWPNWWTSTAKLPVFDAGQWLLQIGLIYWGHQAYNFAWWSLNVEVLFYLVLPLLLPVFALAYRRHSVAIVVYAVAFAVALLAAVQPLPHDGALQIVAHFLPYVSCFVGGLYIATVGQSLPGGWLWAGVGLAWVIACEVTSLPNPHLGWGLFHLVLVAKVMNGGPLAKFFSRPDAVWLGERSYSLFLTHFSVIGVVCWLVAFAVPDKGMVYLLVTRLASIVLSIGVAMLVFETVEKRFARNLVTADQFWSPWMMALLGKSK
jgi:peptidoglycan/LPS O-acetylase OafA/YrhL